MFHFLTDAGERARYVAHLRTAVRPEGSAIIATFGQDGPEKCSGLQCFRYSPDSLQRELGVGFRLDECLRESHHTPLGTMQQFAYQRFTRPADAAT